MFPLQGNRWFDACNVTCCRVLMPVFTVHRWDWINQGSYFCAWSSSQLVVCYTTKLWQQGKRDLAIVASIKVQLGTSEASQPLTLQSIEPPLCLKVLFAIALHLLAEWLASSGLHLLQGCQPQHWERYLPLHNRNTVTFTLSALQQMVHIHPYDLHK